MFGDVFSEGVQVLSYNCMTGPVSPVARVQTFIIGGGPACLRIMEHDEYGRQVWDCENPAGSDDWCIVSHGSYNGGECPEGECSPVAVQSVSWGSIKALYR